MHTEIKIEPGTLAKLAVAVKGNLKEVADLTPYTESYIWRVLNEDRRITTRNFCIIEAAKKVADSLEKERDRRNKIIEKINTELND